jgi:hypothetical protein
VCRAHGTHAEDGRRRNKRRKGRKKERKKESIKMNKV